jgi:hypothetical protein
MKILTSIFLALALCMFLACDNPTPKCPLGSPQAIFAPSLPGVSGHSYEVKGQESLEELMLERGVYLKVYQTGCDALRQEFQFQVQGDYATFPDSLWLKEAVRQFYSIGNLSEKQAGLKLWAAAIEGVRPQMRLAEPMRLEDNIFVQVDRILGAQESTLRVILLQEQ